MITLSTGLRDHLAVTGSLSAALTGNVVRIYAGAVPANPDAALGAATLLCEVTGTPDGIEWEPAAVNGVLIKSAAQDWEGTKVATDTATFFRIVPESDVGDASTSAVRVQGTVGILGADMELSNVDFVNGEPLVLNAAAITVAAGA